MSIIEYFDPVSLLKPNESDLLLNKNLVCKNIDIHTPDNTISSIKGYDIVIIGVPEFRGCTLNDIKAATDKIRNKFYLLNFFDKKLKIADLGNLKSGLTIKDTYFGLRDVLLDIFEVGAFPIIIGGSQDLTYGISLAFENIKKPYTLTTIDYRADIAFETFDKITHKNYLNSIVLEHRFLQEQINIGHQACFSNSDSNDIFESLFHENVRLGVVRNNIKSIEPLLRDSNIISIDFSSVRNADAPGQLTVSPNGFNAEDICQIAHYSGLSEGMKVFAMFDIADNFDSRDLTSALAAQTIWYFINALTIKPDETPGLNSGHFTQFIVTLDDENQIIFYKSLLTERWWCEVPGKNEEKRILACNESDYIQASQNNLPDRWLKMFKKLN